VLDLESTVCTLIECESPQIPQPLLSQSASVYCTKEQQQLFGSNPDDWRSELSVPAASRQAEPSPILPSPLPVIDKVPQTQSNLPIIRAFKKAIRTHDGPMFVDAMGCINTLFRSFKYPNLSDDLMQPRIENSLMRIPGTWTDTGMPKGVYLRIFEELYQRTVGPNVPVLNKYKSFSNTVYGELLPSLVDEMIRLTNLNENSLFLDLGSGVGNVLAQASLQTGCRSFGIELMAEPARVARDVVQQMKTRATMWGVRMGEIELEEGDMLQSRRVDELMPQADVVLVDNKVFSVECE
jgi:[histone H3]-lysine79 N-trimethyltransferase